MAVLDTAGDGSVVVVAGLALELQAASAVAARAETHKAAALLVRVVERLLRGVSGPRGPHVLLVGTGRVYGP